MKIICTKQEKKELIAVLLKADRCPKFLAESSNYKQALPPNKCIYCLNNNIEWEITDE